MTKTYNEAQNLVNKIRRAGYEAHIVGGFVRDYVMSNGTKTSSDDIDITTNASAIFIINTLNGTQISNKDNSLLVYMVDGFEVALYRKESNYDGRRPGTVAYNNVTLVDDLNRRDFTINALYFDTNNNVATTTQGLEDIRNGIIRAVSSDDEKVESRFLEDYLRMVRAVRFSCTLQNNNENFKIEKLTGLAIRENAHRIVNISGERIYLELLKVIKYGKLAEFIEALDKYNLLIYIFPEIKALQGKIHKEEHHPEGDAYQHTLCALRNCSCGSKLYDVVSQLAILFHDCGKAVTQGDDDPTTYHGHDKAGSVIWKRVAARLGISSNIRDAVDFAIVNHMKVSIFPWPMKKSKVAKIVSSEYWETLWAVFVADSISSGKDYIEIHNYIKTEILPFINKDGKGVALNITGKDLLSMGFKQGPMIGQVLNYLKSWVIDNNLPNTRSDLMRIAENSYGYLKNAQSSF